MTDRTLSPEAPAQEGVDWFGVTGAADETEALAVALFDARCPGIRMTDEDLHYYRAAAQRAMQAVADELDTPALTPRHEAPASDWDAIRSHPCYDEHQAGCDCVIPAQSETEVPPFLKRMTDAKHEAPAEGAGEDEDALIRELSDAAGWRRMPGNENHHATALLFERAVSALRARSSAPEAREEALGNLLAVIHGDGGHRALEVGVEQAAAEAEKIVARLLSSAPEAREGEAVAKQWRAVDEQGPRTSWRELDWRSKDEVRDWEASHTVEYRDLYTHLAAPSADKLRDCEGCGAPPLYVHDDDCPVMAANLAALKAKGA